MKSRKLTLHCALLRMDLPSELRSIIVETFFPFLKNIVNPVIEVHRSFFTNIFTYRLWMLNCEFEIYLNYQKHVPRTITNFQIRLSRTLFKCGDWCRAKEPNNVYLCTCDKNKERNEEFQVQTLDTFEPMDIGSSKENPELFYWYHNVVLSLIEKYET